MLPQVQDDLRADFEEVVEPSKTFKIHLEKNRCLGFVDEREAMKQAIFLMLSTERYDYLIYSWNYGIESKDLIGKPIAYVVSEIKRRIRECLLQDDRIDEVDSFEVASSKNKVQVRFIVHTSLGEITAEKEVDY